MTPKQNLLVILLSCLIAISILYLVLYAILSKSLRQQQAADEKRKAYEMPELRNNRQNESSSSIQVLDNQQRKDMKNQAENALMSHRGGKPNTSPPPPQIAVQDNRMSDLIKLESEGEIVQGQVIASGTGNSNNNVLAGLIPTPKVETNKADDLAAQPRQGLPNPFASPTNGGEQTIENAVRKYEGEVTKKAFVPEQKIAGIESAVNLDDDEEDDNIKNKALNE